MKRSTFSRPLTFAIGLGIFLLLPSSLHSSAEDLDPPRIKRADAFFGLHFDFHAQDTDADIGKNTTPAMIENIINQVHPDYLQIDCKGHKGYSSYPTKVGSVPTAGITGDPLKIWRQVTAAHGVSLIMHYSGVIDAKAVEDHPDWCVVGPTGKTGGRSTSLFGPYVDRLMIPQLKELALDYGVDGAWVDGDCWGVEPDYSPAVLEAFKKATGITDVPRSAKDPHWFDFLQFTREAYRGYLRHYITEVKKVAPNFQFCSAQAFSDHMPEPVCAPVDFLSGDVVASDSINDMRVAARFFAGQGKPWDLMAWGFGHSKEDKTIVVQRPVAELEREAAIVLEFGGGFEIYLKEQRDGSVKGDLTGIAEVAKFCRDRQAFCHHAQQVPQVAMLLSTSGYYHEINRPFAKKHTTYLNPLKALIFAKYSVELLDEQGLTGRMQDYPLIVVPNWTCFDPGFKEQLVTYVKDGGQLLLVGPKVAEMFQTEMDVHVEEAPATIAPGQPMAETPATTAPDQPAEEASATTAPDQADKPTRPSNEPPLKITLGPKAAVLDIPIKSSTPIASTDPGASWTPLGKGRIAAIYDGQPLGALLAGAAQRLFPEPLVEIDGHGAVEIAINRLNGKLSINLVNASGKLTGSLDVIIRQQPKPTKVTLQPANQALPFKYVDGKILVTVPQVEIHDVIVVE